MFGKGLQQPSQTETAAAPQHCVNTHLSAPNMQTTKTSAATEVFTHVYDQLII